MGGLCSKRSAVDKSPSESTLDSNGLRDRPMPNQSHSKMKGALAYSIAGETMEKRLQEQTFSVTEGMSVPAEDLHAASAEATEPQLSRAFSQNSRSTMSTMSKPSDPGKSGTAKASLSSDSFLLYNWMVRSGSRTSYICLVATSSSVEDHGHWEDEMAFYDMSPLNYLNLIDYIKLSK